MPVFLAMPGVPNGTVQNPTKLELASQINSRIMRSNSFSQDKGSNPRRKKVKIRKGKERPFKITLKTKSRASNVW
jgi:hypothetical protein